MSDEQEKRGMFSVQAVSKLGKTTKSTGLALFFDLEHACEFAEGRSNRCAAISYTVVDAISLETVASYKHGAAE